MPRVVARHRRRRPGRRRRRLRWRATRARSARSSPRNGRPASGGIPPERNGARWPPRARGRRRRAAGGADQSWQAPSNVVAATVCARVHLTDTCRRRRRYLAVIPAPSSLITAPYGSRRTCVWLKERRGRDCAHARNEHAADRRRRALEGAVLRRGRGARGLGARQCRGRDATLELPGQTGGPGRLSHGDGGARPHDDGARGRDRGDGPGAAVGLGQRRRAQPSRRHRLGDHGVQRAPAPRRVDDAADGEQHLRDLRGQSGHRRAWRRVPPGPPVERLRGRPAQRAPPVVAYLQLAGHRAQRRRRVGRCGLRSDRRLRLRARRQDRTRAVAQRRAGPGRPQEGGRRAGKRFRDRHPAAGCQRPRLPVDRGAARWRHRLRARRQDRPDDLVVRHGARPSGRQGHRRRRLEPAGVGPDGTVYFGTGNMYQPATVALKTPGRRLYADSTVALDGKTGKLKWFYQAVPNDFHDWDLQLSPIYTKSDGRDILLEAGKMGYVYAVDPATGRLIWKTKVGVHNGHDDDGVLAMRHALRVPSKYTVEPGIVGGVETNMAVADGVVYVPVANLA